MKGKLTLFLILSGLFLADCNICRAQVDTPMDQWAFSSSRVTIDNMRYKLDDAHLLAQWCYWNNTNVAPEDVVVPQTVTYQDKTYTVVATEGYGSYEQATAKSFTLPATLRRIGEYTFYPFTSIHEYRIPASVEYIERNAVGRENRSIWFEGNTPPEMAGNFCSSGSRLKVYVPAAGFEEYIKTDYIENCCVVCQDIEKSSYETGIVDSGELGYIAVANQLPKIVTYSMINRLKVNSGTIDENDWYQLRQMKNLVELDISGLSIEEMPRGALESCWQLERIVLPPAMKTIRERALYATGIKSLELPQELESILGSYNFAECDSLSEITIPNGVKSLPSYCFYSCDRLHVVNLPAYLETLSSSCFEYCDIYRISLPGTLGVVGYESFYGNKNLVEVIFHEGTHTVSSYAFAQCKSLPAVAFPASMRLISGRAFQGNPMLGSILLNEGLERIEEYAFDGSTALTEVRLPSSLIYCLGYPFDDCPNIATIYCYSLLPPTVRNNIITRSARNIELRVPQWSFQEYMTKPGWLEFQDHTVIDPEILPANIIINKEFEFVLTPQQMAEGYNPNMHLLWNVDEIDDGFGHTKVERGNLTISSRSKLNVHDFSMYVSPYAKYRADYDRFAYNNNYDYDSWRTKWNPNSLIVKGEMRAENQIYRLLMACDIWQFISFPFDVKVSDIVPVNSETQWVIRAYDSQKRAEQKFDETWVNLTADDVLEAGRGYILKCYHNDYRNNASNNSDPIEFVVTPIENSLTRQQLFDSNDREVTLTESQSEFEQNRSWNLIGNPYPCYFDSRYIDTDAPFLVWDSYNGTYAAFSPVDDSYILNPGEAFFIQRPVDQTEPLTFLRDGRQTYRNPNDLKVKEVRRRIASRQNADRQVVNLRLTLDDHSDRARVVFNKVAAMGYETGRDAAKMNAMEPTAPQLWSQWDGVRYAINERPLSTGIVELGLSARGMVTIALETDCEGILLEDRLAGTTLPLTTEGYTFQADGLCEGRFCLVNGAATGIECTPAIASPTEQNLQPAYNLQGQRVDADYRGIVVRNGKKMLSK
ncbi:MAG: leucine-rich repeat domain-containing protein [Bacteroidaceae bacterium]|nr:leucine-rich repeat domain-containing protein [Bacteroidaceae bacterium]